MKSLQENTAQALVKKKKTLPTGSHECRPSMEEAVGADQDALEGSVGAPGLGHTVVFEEV